MSTVRRQSDDRKTVVLTDGRQHVENGWLDELPGLDFDQRSLTESGGPTIKSGRTRPRIGCALPRGAILSDHSNQDEKESRQESNAHDGDR